MHTQENCYTRMDAQPILLCNWLPVAQPDAQLCNQLTDVQPYFQAARLCNQVAERIC